MSTVCIFEFVVPILNSYLSIPSVSPLKFPLTAIESIVVSVISMSNAAFPVSFSVATFIIAPDVISSDSLPALSIVFAFIVLVPFCVRVIVYVVFVFIVVSLTLFAPAMLYFIPFVPDVSSFPGVIATVILPMYAFSVGSSPSWTGAGVPFISIFGMSGFFWSITTCLSLFMLIAPSLSSDHALIVYTPSCCIWNVVFGTVPCPVPPKCYRVCYVVFVFIKYFIV